MKLLAALLVMMVLLITFGLWVNHSLATTAKDMSNNVHQIAVEINKNDWQGANQHIEAMEKQWNQISIWWPMILDHQEIDNIEFSLAKVKEYIKEKNKVLSSGQLSELKLMILHLPEKEAVTLKNIF